MKGPLLCQEVILKIREWGLPERINRNSLGAMVGPGPLGDAIVLCCFRGIPCHPRPVGSDEQDLGRKKRGRVSARPDRRRFPVKRRVRVLVPRAEYVLSILIDYKQL